MGKNTLNPKLKKFYLAVRAHTTPTAMIYLARDQPASSKTVGRGAAKSRL